MTKTHKATNGQVFKRLNFDANDFYEVELVESILENREAIIAGILQYSMLNWDNQNCFKFFATFATSTNLKSSNWTHFQFLALAEEYLY